MYKYTLAFIKSGNNFLMLNRNKNPWIGMWNGFGGKRNKNESAIDCIIRELAEETGLVFDAEHVYDRGVVSWNGSEDVRDLGLHLFFIDVGENYQYPTPVESNEGIISWKSLEWIMDTMNLGVAFNIPYFIGLISNSLERYRYECTFAGSELAKVEIQVIKGE